MNDHPPAAKRTIQGHLEQVETYLCLAKTPQDARDEILASIASQYQDHLGKPYAEADQTDIHRALAELEPPQAYRPDDDRLGLGELLHQLGTRLLPSHVAPVCVVDPQGQRKILWGVLLPRVILLMGFMFCAMAITLKLTRPDQPLLNLQTLAMSAFTFVGVTWGIGRKIRRTPLESLTREADLDPRLSVSSIGSFGYALMWSAFFLGLGYSGAYIVTAAYMREPLWPFSAEVFARTIFPVTMAGFALVLTLGYRHRRNLKRIEQFI